jgi:hypothetical protein
MITIKTAVTSLVISILQLLSVLIGVVALGFITKLIVRAFSIGWGVI